MEEYSVGEVAKFARVTVRTLHHYDEMGLLRPRKRRNSGYRSYSEDDLERLQRIMCYRQLGLPLDQIKSALDDPTGEPMEHLRRQHALLTARIRELQQMVATVETLMEAHTMGIHLDPHDYLEVFGESDPAQYAEEAEQRWGESDAWAESQRRTKSYTKDDWKRLQAEYTALMSELAAAMTEGQPADSPRAMDLAERHRAYLTQWFYDCGYAMHRGLADLFVNDPRFTANIDKTAPGLAAYFHDAIYANAARHGQ